MTYPENQFGPDHYSWLIGRNQLEMPTCLGPIAPAEPTDRTAVVEQELRQWSVIDSNGEITEQARALFEGVTHYKYSFWGTLLLINEKEPIEVELDQELIDWGVAASLVDVPRVFWQITRHAGGVTVAMRAGDSIVVTRREGSDGGMLQDCAEELLNVINPTGSWPAGKFKPVMVPMSVFESMPQSLVRADSDASKAMRKLRQLMAQEKVPTDMIERYSKLLSVEKLAHTNVLFSPAPGKISSMRFEVEFLYEIGMVLSGYRNNFEGEESVYVAPATVSSIADQMSRIREGAIRRMN